MQPFDRSWCSMNAISSDQVLIYGGLSNDTHTFSDLWRIRVKKTNDRWYDGKWTMLNRTAGRRHKLTGEVIEGQLLGWCFSVLCVFYICVSANKHIWCKDWMCTRMHFN